MAKRSTQTKNGRKEPGPVGPGMPPVEHQFKKGISGNPNGRPRKSRDLKKLIEAELDQLVEVSEDGKRLTKREIMVKRLVNGAVRGEDKPLQALIKLIGVAPEPDPVVAVDPAELARFALRHLPKSPQKEATDHAGDGDDECSSSSEEPEA